MNEDHSGPPCLVCPKPRTKFAPKGYAIFFVGQGQFEGELTRIRTDVSDLSNLWPGHTPADAAERLRDRYPGTYEGTTLYIGRTRGQDFGDLLRVRFEMMPVQYRAVAA